MHTDDRPLGWPLRLLLAACLLAHLALLDREPEAHAAQDLEQLAELTR